jgi:uncharacterized membrane protein SpoIIM required for sporulation/uncharacterized RDD family membrane protein YckC
VTGTARALPRGLDATVDVETPEQVVLSYSLAGVGSRALAAIVDYAICFALMFTTVLVGALLARSGLARVLGNASDPWFSAVLVIVQFLIIWGYYVLFEGLNDGQTPGKKWLGLRVVQDGGFSVSFGASAVRNLLRAVDQQPVFLYTVGLIGVAASKQGKRVGDVLAGTIVVRERARRTRDAGAFSGFTAPSGARRTAAADAAARGSGGGDGGAVLQTLLTDEEFAVLTRFLDAQRGLDASRREALRAQLAERFRSRAPDLGGTDSTFLSTLAERERVARTRGVAARSDTGAAREQHALVAAGAARWGAFATRLAEVQRRGLAGLSEAEVSDFVAQYREMSADLARLQTAARGRSVDAVFALSRLVATAHNLVYRQRTLTPRAALDYLSFTVPAELRRSWRPVLLAALLLFGPAAVAWTGVVRNPAVAPEFIGPGMLERAELGVKRAETGEGYIPDPELMRPVFASRIVANNVQVSFFAFAFGATAGIGTLLLLVVNGVSLGGVMGLYQAKGILSLIGAFVAPHGLLELAAICIAGGAGFLMASAILMPGARTRREALVSNGKRAIHLVAAATFLLVIAGVIEGFISPIPWWPLWWKVSVTAVTGLFLAGFVLLGFRTTARPAP